MARYIDADKLKMDSDIDNFDIPYGCSFRVIDRQPTADVEVVRHAYWKDRYDNKYDNHLYVCSECGGKALLESYKNELDQWKERQVLSSGCPHCRAKMDGGKAE